VVPLAYVAYRFIEKPMLKINSRSRTRESGMEVSSGALSAEALPSGSGG